METTPRRVKRGVTMRRKILGRCLGTVALAAAALLIARLDVQAAAAGGQQGSIAAAGRHQRASG